MTTLHFAAVADAEAKAEAQLEVEAEAEEAGNLTDGGSLTDGSAVDMVHFAAMLQQQLEAEQLAAVTRLQACVWGGRSLQPNRVAFKCLTSCSVRWLGRWLGRSARWSASWFDSWSAGHL